MTNKINLANLLNNKNNFKIYKDHIINLKLNPTKMKLRNPIYIIDLWFVLTIYLSNKILLKKRSYI